MQCSDLRSQRAYPVVEVKGRAGSCARGVALPTPSAHACPQHRTAVTPDLTRRIAEVLAECTREMRMARESIARCDLHDRLCLGGIRKRRVDTQQASGLHIAPNAAARLQQVVETRAGKADGRADGLW